MGSTFEPALSETGLPVLKLRQTGAQAGIFFTTWKSFHYAIASWYKREALGAAPNSLTG